jgi:hypothetical protein
VGEKSVVAGAVGVFSKNNILRDGGVFQEGLGVIKLYRSLEFVAQCLLHNAPHGKYFIRQVVGLLQGNNGAEAPAY